MAAYLGVRSVVLCAGPWVSGRMCVVPVPFGAGFISVIYIPSICIYTSLPGGTVGTCGYLPVRTSVRIGNGRVQVGARTVRVYGTADAFVVVGHVLCGRELGGYALISPLLHITLQSFVAL